MKVILIACSYPPDPLVGSFRPAKVANALVERGHEVDVITARIPEDATLGRVSGATLRVHPVRLIRNPRYAYVALKNALTTRVRRPYRATPSEAGRTTAPGHSGPAPGAVRRFFISLLWLPDEHQGFIPAALLKALTIARRGGDLIYTTAPPFSDHLVGWILKLLTGLPWIMELRDPWTDAERDASMRSRPVDAVNRWLERRCLASADQIVAVSQPVFDRLAARLGPAAQDRLRLVLNGIDTIRTVPPDAAPDAPFLIVHAGSLYNDPRPFLRSVAAVAGRLGLGPKDLRIEFMGQEPYFSGPTVHELAVELGIEEMVSFSGWIPQPACRKRIAAADLLLLLCEGFPTAIPNKLFDYLGERKPILGIVDPDGESARVLRSQSGHYVTSSAELDTLDRLLERALLERSAKGRLVNDSEFLRQWSASTQMHTLVQLIQHQVRASDAGNSGRRSRNPHPQT